MTAYSRRPSSRPSSLTLKYQGSYRSSENSWNRLHSKHFLKTEPLALGPDNCLIFDNLLYGALKGRIPFKMIDLIILSPCVYLIVLSHYLFATSVAKNRPFNCFLPATAMLNFYFTTFDHFFYPFNNSGFS